MKIKLCQYKVIKSRHFCTVANSHHWSLNAGTPGNLGNPPKSHLETYTLYRPLCGKNNIFLNNRYLHSFLGSFGMMYPLNLIQYQTPKEYADPKEIARNLPRNLCENKVECIKTSKEYSDPKETGTFEKTRFRAATARPGRPGWPRNPYQAPQRISVPQTIRAFSAIFSCNTL